MSVDLNAYTPARYPVDGAFANSNTPASRIIQAMIRRSFNAGGGIVELPAGVGTILFDETVQMLSGVDLWIPKGCVVAGVPGFAGPFLNADTVTDCRIFGGGWLFGPFDFSLNFDGIVLTNSQEVFVEGIRIMGMPLSGIKISGDGYNHVTRVLSHDNGLHGVYLTNGTIRNKISDTWAYSNGQAGGAVGDGIHLDGATLRTLITNLHAFDPGATFAAAQAYPVREAAASACDYTIVNGMDASGNVTSNSPSFVGANSKWVDNAATIATVGLPANVAGTAALGTGTNAAKDDHVHALTTVIAAAGTAGGAGADIGLTGGVGDTPNGAGGNGVIRGGDGTGIGAGGNSYLLGGHGGSSGGANGAAFVQGGDAVGTLGAGGPVIITGGVGGSSVGGGGDVSVTGGLNRGVSGRGGNATLAGGLGGVGGTAGGDANVFAGDASAVNGPGGSVFIAGGDSFGSGLGGIVDIRGGSPGPTAIGGSIQLIAGSGGATSGAPGDVTLQGGAVGGSGKHGNIVLSGPVKAIGTAPSLAPGADAGAAAPTPTAQATSGEYVGRIQFGTGAGAVAGVMVILTYAHPFAVGISPTVLLTPGNDATAALGLFYFPPSASAVSIGCHNPPASGQAVSVYQFSYQIIGI